VSAAATTETATATGRQDQRQHDGRHPHRHHHPAGLYAAGRQPHGQDRRRRRRHGRVHGVADRGSATVELAVLFPAFLLLVFGGVQAAQWYHVRSLCLAAADAGVQAGRTAGAGDADASRAATEFLARAGGTATDPTVSTAGSSAALQRVEVTASVPRVIPLPGLSMRVTQSSQATREVFTTDTRGSGP
jgi:Flp pilus assembly protein TadG